MNLKEVIIQPDRSLFAICKTRGTRIKEQLCHSFWSVAWPLATPKGRVYKSVKSNLLNVMEETIETFNEIPPKSARIYDGMGIMRQLPKYD